MSMPYIGLIPFLLKGISVLSQSVMIVSCPTSGLSHFYKDLHLLLGNVGGCVNALHRAYPISTLRRGFLRSHLYVVSMPYIGLIPFLLSDVYNESHQYKVVSMPYIGLIPFLQYPLKNLIKSMVSGTVFRG